MTNATTRTDNQNSRKAMFTDASKPKEGALIVEDANVRFFREIVLCEHLGDLHELVPLHGGILQDSERV